MHEAMDLFPGRIVATLETGFHEAPVVGCEFDDLGADLAVDGKIATDEHVVASGQGP